MSIQPVLLADTAPPRERLESGRTASATEILDVEIFMVNILLVVRAELGRKRRRKLNRPVLFSLES
tara:strand:- start:197 stop:394 length:198 start_codon:yes stop_codon:yes gene_type:complete